MNTLLKNVLAVAAAAIATQALAQITFYEHEGFAGRSFGTQQEIGNFKSSGFNDRASSAVVFGRRWEVCENAGFNGRCVVLPPGRYASLAAMGLNDRVSSVRDLRGDRRIDDEPSAAPVAQITFYEREGFAGQIFSTQQEVSDLRREGVNDRASSVVVVSGHWQVCDAVGFTGRCVVLPPGHYSSLADMGLNDSVSSVRAIGAQSVFEGDRHVPPMPMPVQITFYDNEGFGGRAFNTQQDVGNFRRAGFNDRASSVVVAGGLWEVCDAVGFKGQCRVFRPGQYASLVATGLNDKVSSVRRLGANTHTDERRYAPVPIGAYDYRRRNNEPLYQADVMAVRAVVGTPEQRCWIEREQVTQDRGNANLPAAVAGALIGGILGHQVGDGRGKDLATVGGAVIGAVVGSNIGRDSGSQPTQDMRRCTSVPSQSRPDYWDVTYSFRGQEHRMQMSSAPGPTVTVNAQGEPRA